MGRAFEVRKSAMEKTSVEKSKIYSRFGREIYQAAKNGSTEVNSNPQLKSLIEKAKKLQVPNSIINKAIDKAKSGIDENYMNVKYECFGTAGALYIVEGLTNNVNRTIAEVRHCLNKSEGKVGVTGSVDHMFLHRGRFLIEEHIEDKILEIIVDNDIDAVEIEAINNSFLISVEQHNYSYTKAKLEEILEKKLLSSELIYIPINEIRLSEDADKLNHQKIINSLSELEDVMNVYHNIKQ